jgi:hypothetical protein
MTDQQQPPSAEDRARARAQLYAQLLADPESPERTYLAIGRFMFEFSQAEYTIRHYLAMEIGLNEEFFSAVVESYDVGMLTSVARQVFKTSRVGQPGVDIENLLKRFLKLNDDRKRVAHGLWVPFMEGGTVHYVARNKLTPERRSNQALALEKLADELCQLRADMERVFLYEPLLNSLP